MPKTQTYVEINHDGDWQHALVTDTKDPNNLRLTYWVGSDRQDVSAKKGTDPGEWREPS